MRQDDVSAYSQVLAHQLTYALGDLAIELLCLDSRQFGIVSDDLSN